MGKIVKKLLASALAMVMMTSAISTAGFAQEGSETAETATAKLSVNNLTAMAPDQTIQGKFSLTGAKEADSIDVTFTYDADVFADFTVKAGKGVTVLGEKAAEGELDVILMADPKTADYSQLLKVFVTAGPEEGVGKINIDKIDVAGKGETIEAEIAPESEISLSVVAGDISGDTTIRTLSKAISFFMTDTDSANWAEAAKFDLSGNGVIDMDDFVKIANVILETKNAMPDLAKLVVKAQALIEKGKPAACSDENWTAFTKASDSAALLLIAGSDNAGYLAAAKKLQAAMNVAFPDDEGIQLRFNEEGKFKIMQMSDFQDYIDTATKPNVHPKSIELMNAALDREQPDMVVMDGDMIGGNMDAKELQEYIRQMVAPLEEHKVPWLVTYGNHDEDATDALKDGWNKIKQLEFYRSFPHNINRPSMSGEEGFYSNNVNTYAVGDMYKLVYDQDGKTPLFNVWALDSNTYRGNYAAGDDRRGDGYDFIHQTQVDWYANTSKELQNKYGEKIPSMMFYHIPLPEWGDMWANKNEYGVVGEKNEKECPSNVNSGLFNVAKDRGDVLGMFVGHDHVNTYIGNYNGIYLGYDGSIGYQTYGLGGTTANNNRLRGIRTFTLDKSDLSVFETEMILGTDLGVSVS